MKQRVVFLFLVLLLIPLISQAEDMTGQLAAAIENGDAKAVTELLDKGVYPEVRIGENRETPLLLSTRKGYRDIVDLLLSRGADAEARNDDGMTPLLFGARRGNKEIVALLLSKGADLNARDNNGNTALMHAARTDVATAEYLLSKGVDIMARNDDGDTALQVAERVGYLDMISFLRSEMY